MNLRALSGVARPLDFGYATNRWITGLTAAVLLAAGLWRGAETGDWAGSFAWGALAALAVFLAWALCRELDPDSDLAAFAAAGLAGAGLFLSGLPGLAALFVVLLAVRVLNRTTGVAATPLDAAGLLGLGIWMAVDGSWLYLMVAIGALALDGLLPHASGRRFLFGAAAGAAAVAGVYLIGSQPDSVSIQPLAILAALAMGAAFAAGISAARHVAAPADVTKARLAPIRVRAGQVLALLVGCAAALLHGNAGLAELMPLWAAMLAAGLYRLVDRSVARTPGRTEQ